MLSLLIDIMLILISIIFHEVMSMFSIKNHTKK